jgi:hypothetical protein
MEFIFTVIYIFLMNEKIQDAEFENTTAEFENHVRNISMLTYKISVLARLIFAKFSFLKLPHKSGKIWQFDKGILNL